MRTPLLVLLALAAGLLPACEAARDPDLNDDGIVDRADVRIVLDCIGRNPRSVARCALADTDGDGVVDDGDLFSLAPAFGRAVCNGSPTLCERRYDEAAHPTSHNAFAGPFEKYDVFFNHFDTLPEQLEAGIRGVMLDTWYDDADGDGTTGPDETFLCHVECAEGRSQPLVEGLLELRDFLERHPGEVLTLIFEAYVSVPDTVRAFESAGLLPYLHAQPAGSPWPTLGEMIRSGRRLVVLSDDPGAGPDWHHYVWDLAWETPFSVSRRSDFSCDDNRGEPDAALFILNHFLTRNASVPTQAATVNANPLLVDRAVECWRASGRFPNFPTVDFATTGDVVEAARLLNDLWQRSGGRPPAS